MLQVSFKQIIIFVLFISIKVSAQSVSDSLFKNGDIIFIRNKSTMNSDVLPKGKTNFNYVGIVFFENNTPMVYHATEPISKCTVNEFISMSETRYYKIRRILDPSLLNKDVIKTMHTFAKAKLNNHYDNQLNLNNETFYNSEFVWKIYQSCLGINLAEPKTINSLSNSDESISELKNIYGDKILTEKLIVIGDLYRSEFLE